MHMEISTTYLNAHSNAFRYAVYDKHVSESELITETISPVDQTIRDANVETTQALAYTYLFVLSSENL